MQHEHKYKKECYKKRCFGSTEEKCVESCIYCNKKKDPPDTSWVEMEEIKGY